VIPPIAGSTFVRHLRGNERVPRAARARITGQLATHRPHQFNSGGLQRRHEPEEQRRSDCAAKQEHDDPPVNGKGCETDLLRHRRLHRAHRHANPCFENQSQHGITAEGGGECEQQAFREQLPDDAPA
jgi:hypothetical protein